jgi:hypothetical protein
MTDPNYTHDSAAAEELRNFIPDMMGGDDQSHDDAGAELSSGLTPITTEGDEFKFGNNPDDSAFPEQDLFSELYGSTLPVSIADLPSNRI